MPGGDQRVTARLSGEVLPMFAWADGIASRLADAYRSGMCVNFVLAALAVIIGLAFLPAGLGAFKWIFAAIELLLLAGILGMTVRRIAARLAPALVRVAACGRISAPCARLLLLWRRAPRRGAGPERAVAGQTANGPSIFARHALRAVGLPLRAPHPRLSARRPDRCGAAARRHQRAYHEAKAHRLEKVHHRLDGGGGRHASCSR